MRLWALISSAAGFAGAQGKVNDAYKGIVPIVGYVALGASCASAILGFRKEIALGLLGTGGVISVGPNIMATVSGTAL